MNKVIASIGVLLVCAFASSSSKADPLKSPFVDLQNETGTSLPSCPLSLYPHGCNTGGDPTIESAPVVKRMSLENYQHMVLMGLGHLPPTAPSGCRSLRFIVDVGSATAKGLGAMIDQCGPVTKHEILFEDKIPLGLAEAKVTHGGTLPLVILQEVVLKILTLKDKFSQRFPGPALFTLVATEVFRQLPPENLALARAVFEDYDLPLRVLTKEQEALFAWESATILLRERHHPIEGTITSVDSGGGSFQYTVASINAPSDMDKGEVLVYGDAVGNTAIRNYISALLGLQGQALGKNSFLPMAKTPEEAAEKVLFLTEVCVRTLGEKDRTAIANLKEKSRQGRVVGVARAHAFSVLPLIEKQPGAREDVMTLLQIRDTLIRLAQMSPEEIRAKYPSTNSDPSFDFANALLTAALLHLLGAEEMQVLVTGSPLFSALTSRDVTWERETFCPQWAIMKELPPQDQTSKKNASFKGESSFNFSLHTLCDRLSFSRYEDLIPLSKKVDISMGGTGPYSD